MKLTTNCPVCGSNNLHSDHTGYAAGNDEDLQEWCLEEDCDWSRRETSSDIDPDPAHDTTGNGTECHYDLARQLEMRGYEVRADTDDNQHSEVYFNGVHVGDIRGDGEATVTTIS